LSCSHVDTRLILYIATNKAWSASCSIDVHFAQAKLWFSGKYAYNALEDVAEEMMKCLTDVRMREAVCRIDRCCKEM
jgi:hypothetical protein